MEEWKKYKLGEIAVIKGGKRLPKGIELISIPNSHPYIRIRDMYVNKIMELNGDFEYVDDVTQKSIQRYIVKQNDIILAIVGNTLGLVSMVGKSLDSANLTENCVKIVSDNLTTQNYIYYYLNSDFGQNEIKKGIVGAAQPKLPIKNIMDISIALPPLKYQKAVIDVLSSIDDKIELNCRINDNLEQQAQALFDHYFDSGSIYLEDSIMGCLTDIAVYLNGLAMQKFPATDIERSLPVLKIKELGQRKCDDCSDRCSDSIDADYIIDNEDIIFSWSGTLMVDVWCGGKCGLNQHLFKVTPLKNYPRWFVYYWTNRHLKKFKLIAKDKAVTMGHIRRGDLENAEVAIPTNLNMLEINARINPLFQSIIDRRLEITKLENIRDALLPKLMSGELTINEI